MPYFKIKYIYIKIWIKGTKKKINKAVNCELWMSWHYSQETEWKPLGFRNLHNTVKEHKKKLFVVYNEVPIQKEKRIPGYKKYYKLIKSAQKVQNYIDKWWSLWIFKFFIIRNSRDHGNSFIDFISNKMRTTINFKCRNSY